MTKHPSRDLIAALAIVALAAGACGPEPAATPDEPVTPGVGRRRGARGHLAEW